MTVYALLVGINRYKSPLVRDLSGCVADVRRFEAFLNARVKPDELAEPKVLLDEQATRQGIIDSFETYLNQAQAGDVALFYYSGHGSQENAPPAFWAVEPDRKNETLVCHDSRSAADAWDLADKELAYLLEKISAGKDIHTLVILDSCHSGSGTRDPDQAGVRMNPADTRVRPLESYLIHQPPAVAQLGENWYTPPSGKHLLLTACRPEEVARERVLGEEREMQGVFSFYLREALKSSGPDLTYRDLFKHVSAMVRLMINSQTPQLETQTENINQKFLGGEVLQPRSTTYNVRFDRGANSFVIDGGTIHGLGAPVDGQATTVAIFPKDDYELDLSQALGTTTVTEVRSTQSKITGDLTPKAGSSRTMAALNENETYKAVVIKTPLPRLLVQLSGDEAAMPAVRAALNTANNGEPSMFVRAAETGVEVEQAQLSLTGVADEQVYRLRRTHDSLALFVDTPYGEPRAAEVTVQQLEQMARWMKIHELHNPNTQIKSDDVTLTVTSVDRDGQETAVDPTNVVHLRYKEVSGTLQKPGLRIEINNHANQTLYAALVNVAPSYKVWPVALPGTLSTVKLDPQTSVQVADGKRITLGIPDSLPSTVTEINDLFKLIVSTTEFDAPLLEEEALAVQYRESTRNAGNFRSGHLIDSLTSLLGRIPFRDGGFDEVETLSDWRTIDLSVTTTRPHSEVTVTAETKSVALGEGVTLTNKAGLNATARLLSDPESARDVGNLAVPSWLREDPPLHAEPFALVPTRSGEPGLSVLELANVDQPEKVAPATPLTLEVPARLAADEHVLAYGFDGEFYLPLGFATQRAGATAITLHQLPAPGGYRTLTNSIRIYFHKLKQDFLGITSPYPRLAMVTPGTAGGAVSYNDDRAAITQAVAEATDILLYIHGIIGETRYAVPSAWTRINGQQLADRYDLVLAFDYENLATGIQKTAEDLFGLLSEVGLKPGHSQKLHIFAHSLGGLVARWLIEHFDGGPSMVEHLYMFGTPNGGSPWPKLQDYAFSLLTIGLNGLAPVTWPVSAATGLLALIEHQDEMLDQMAVDSDLLQDLASGSDPKVAYTLLAGNTSIIPAAWQESDGEPSLIERLLSKLNLRAVADLAFFKAPNDIAASVESIFKVRDDRVPASVKVEVACDHMTYFEPAGGLPVLHTVLGGVQPEV